VEICEGDEKRSLLHVPGVLTDIFCNVSFTQMDNLNISCFLYLTS